MHYLKVVQAETARARGWENEPSVNQYINDLSSCVPMEKLTYITEGKL